MRFSVGVLVQSSVKCFNPFLRVSSVLTSYRVKFIFVDLGWLQNGLSFKNISFHRFYLVFEFYSLGICYFFTWLASQNTWRHSLFPVLGWLTLVTISEKPRNLSGFSWSRLLSFSRGSGCLSESCKLGSLEYVALRITLTEEKRDGNSNQLNCPVVEGTHTAQLDPPARFSHVTVTCP